MHNKEIINSWIPIDTKYSFKWPYVFIYVKNKFSLYMLPS